MEKTVRSMRIAHLARSKFKHFTHLELSGISASAKLVLLIGASGSGKSSVLDAFEFVSSRSRGSCDVSSCVLTLFGS